MSGFSIARIITSLISLAAFSVEIVFLIKWILKVIHKEKDKARTRYAVTVVIAFFIFGVITVANYAIGIAQYSESFDMSQLETFEISSDSLEDGKWKESAGAKKENKSPQLKWDTVKGAKVYAIFMIDPDGFNWLHWAVSTDKSEVLEGEFSGAENGYVGPYPPMGTHRYDVYVFALKGDSYGTSAELDKANADINKIAKELNSGTESEFNNIIAYGKIEGTYSAK